MDPKEWFGCGRKDSLSKTGAIYRAKKDSRRTKKDIRAYKCLFCEYWHVGHYNKKYENINMGQKLPTLPKTRTVKPKPPIDQTAHIKRKCKEVLCNQKTSRANPNYPYCSLECADWDHQIKEN